MRAWKVIGLAGVVGLAAGAVVVNQRRRREWQDYDAEQVRARLHERFGGIEGSGEPASLR